MNPTVRDEREIELHRGDQPRLRVRIQGTPSVLNLPVRLPDGFGLVPFMDSGLRNADGQEIWTPSRVQFQ